MPHLGKRNIWISIHALLAESDNTSKKERMLTDISIHALLAESDAYDAKGPGRVFDFYPRSPCGERRAAMPVSVPPFRFLSTLSLRRATVPRWIKCHPLPFLSTLSLRRATEDANNGTNANLHFYPRSPCGERLYFGLFFGRDAAISIHALLAESDG